MNSKSKASEYRAIIYRDDRNNEINSKRKAKAIDDRITRAIDEVVARSSIVGQEIDEQFKDTEELDWMDSVYAETQWEKEYTRHLYEENVNSHMAECDYYAKEMESMQTPNNGHNGNNKQMIIENDGGRQYEPHKHDQNGQWNGHNGAYNHN